MIGLTLFFVIITFFFPTKGVFVFDLFVLYLWIQRYMLTYSLDKLSVERKISSDYIFIGEVVQITLIIENKSPFPIFFLKIEDLLREEGGLFKKGRGEFFATLSPYERLELSYDIEFRKRGIYSLKKIKFISSGPVSFLKQEKILDAPLKVVVYPKRIPLEYFPFFVRELLPLIRTNYKLLEDLSYIDGVREYTYTEPVKRIHWKASAHMGKLLSKTYEYTATTKIHIFVDLNLSKEIFSKKVWGKMRKRYEEYVISATASLVEYMLFKKVPTKLYIIGKGKKPYIVENMNYADLMEHLAGVSGTDDPLYSIDEVFLSQMGEFTFSSTIILFSLYLTPSVLPLLIKLKSKTARVIVIIAPFGFREPESKRIERNYDIFPQDIRALEDATMILREQGILVKLVEPEDAFFEVIRDV